MDLKHMFLIKKEVGIDNFSHGISYKNSFNPCMSMRKFNVAKIPMILQPDADKMIFVWECL